MDSELAQLVEANKNDFEVIQGRKLRCTLTGHELLLEKKAFENYLSNKKYQAARLTRDLQQFKPHIVDHPELSGKLLCKLTGAVINRSEDAVWKHMMGRKFQRCLEKAEAAKDAGQSARKNGTEQHTMEKIDKDARLRQKHDDGMDVDGQEGRTEEEEEREAEADDSDSSGFWMPPVGDRWDDDKGGDRWRSGEGCTGPRNIVKVARLKKGLESHDVSAANDDDISMHSDEEFGDTGSESDEPTRGNEAPTAQRDKRRADTIGPYGNAPRRKKGKGTKSA